MNQVLIYMLVLFALMLWLSSQAGVCLFLCAWLDLTTGFRSE